MTVFHLLVSSGEKMSVALDRGLNTIARSRPSSRAQHAISTTTNLVSTRASHVTTPVLVSSLTTSVRSSVSAAWTVLTGFLAAAVEVLAIPSTVRVS